MARIASRRCWRRWMRCAGRDDESTSCLWKPTSVISRFAELERQPKRLNRSEVRPPPKLVMEIVRLDALPGEFRSEAMDGLAAGRKSAGCSYFQPGGVPPG